MIGAYFSFGIVVLSRSQSITLLYINISIYLLLDVTPIRNTGPTLWTCRCKLKHKSTILPSLIVYEIIPVAAFASNSTTAHSIPSPHGTCSSIPSNISFDFPTLDPLHSVEPRRSPVNICHDKSRTAASQYIIEKRVFFEFLSITNIIKSYFE